MITIKDDAIIIPRETWDNAMKNFYFKELIENLMDSEELLEAMQESKEMIDLREYDLERRRKI